jgi:hypothetical protein
MGTLLIALGTLILIYLSIRLAVGLLFWWGKRT